MLYVTHIPLVYAYEILRQQGTHFLNGSHFSFSISLLLLPTWLVIELSYPTHIHAFILKLSTQK